MFYIFYNLLIAPGVMAHELAHAVFCWLTLVRVREVRLFRFGNPAGYVIHDQPRFFLQGLLISFGPLMVNSLAAVIFFRMVDPNMASTWWLAWLGFAMGMQAIPSGGDARTLLRLANRRVWRNPLVLVGYPLVLALYVLNLLKKVYLDFIFVGALWVVARVYV